MATSPRRRERHCSTICTRLTACWAHCSSVSTASCYCSGYRRRFRTVLRLAVLLEALASGRAMHGFCLRFFEHRLHVLPVAGAFLCVVSELWSPSPVLKMAMNVTGRRLQ
jgi:hypothetical protein